MYRNSPSLDVASLISEFSTRTEILKQRILELNDRLILETKKTKTIQTDLSNLQSTIAHYPARVTGLERQMHCEKEILEGWKTGMKMEYATGEEKMTSRLQDIERRRVQDVEQQARNSSEFKSILQGMFQQEIKRLDQQAEQREAQLRQWLEKEVDGIRASLGALQLVAFKEPRTRAREKQDKAFEMNSHLISNRVKGDPPALPAMPKRLTRSTAKSLRKENLNKVSKCRRMASKKRKK